MKIYFGMPLDHEIPINSVVGIGVFDGVHLGHCKVISRIVELAEKNNCPAVIITFDTHPRGVIAPGVSPKMITSLQHRLRLFESLGISTTIVLPFSREFASSKADEFIREFLVGKLKVKAVVLGADARFGNDRLGSIELLRDFQDKYSYVCEGIESVMVEGETVSSTAIRASIQVGDLQLAEKMMGRPVTVLGSVAAGAGIGRTLGFPTLNIDLHHELHPPRGVYITQTSVGHSIWNSVTNIGHRPTVDADNRTDVYIESHVMHGNIGDLYGQEAEVRFLEKIRDEKKFASKEELMESIRNDVSAAHKYFLEYNERV